MSTPRAIEILTLSELAARYASPQSFKQLEAFARKEWEKRASESDDLHAQMSWVYQFIADRLGLAVDPDDEGQPITHLVIEDTPEREAARTAFGVGHGHTQPDSLEAALLDTMKALALCFRLAMRAEDALSNAMQAEATLATLKDRQR